MVDELFRESRTPLLRRRNNRRLEVAIWYVHVNQHKIRSNIHAETIDPPISVRRGRNGRAVYGMGVRIPDGSSLVYSPDSPLLPCGARLVIECPTEPEFT